MKMTTHGPESAAAFLALALGASLPAGCAGDRQYSQTELNALQTREFDAGYDRVFDATVGALFDGGYVVQASDKRGGFLRAGRTSDGPKNTGTGGVQVKLDPAGTARTSVRVSTIGAGRARVEKARIDELMTLIDQRLVASGGG